MNWLFFLTTLLVISETIEIKRTLHNALNNKKLDTRRPAFLFGSLPNDTQNAFYESSFLPEQNLKSLKRSHYFIKHVKSQKQYASPEFILNSILVEKNNPYNWRNLSQFQIYPQTKKDPSEKGFLKSVKKSKYFIKSSHKCIRNQFLRKDNLQIPCLTPYNEVPPSYAHHVNIDNIISLREPKLKYINDDKFQKLHSYQSDQRKLKKNNSKLQNRNSTKVKIPKKTSLPTHVVKEVPTLDVGPLTVVTVSKGNTARLPCQQQTLALADTVRLVLWYRNDTSRPLLSYDGRDARDESSYTKFDKQQKKRSSLDAAGRIFLTKTGSFLIIRDAQWNDQAEYRCTVHYKTLPAVTYRLKLVVKDLIKSVELFDAFGKKIQDQIGPLSEGANLSLTCKARYTGKLVDLKWLIDGEVVSASRAHVENSLAEIDVSMMVERRHAQATLTCRLMCQHLHSEGGIKASIIDVSTKILLFYVPQATLLLDETISNGVKIQPEGWQGGGNVEIKENQRIKFICAVRARPPPYNITWLLNGRVLSSGVRRRVVGDTFLEISPVERSDSGVYACLASNKEGDGHSNAIMLVVNHAPYCAGPTNRQLVVVRDSTLTLSCDVESNPPNVTFTWRVDRKQKLKKFSKTKNDAVEQKNGGIVNGEHRFNYIPKMIDLVPKNNQTRQPSYIPPSKLSYMAYGPSLPYVVDPSKPTKSLLRVNVDEESMGINCFAKNKIGRMRVPCSYTLIVIDPLMPPQLCSVMKSESTFVEVVCSELFQGTEPVQNYVPGLSYVRSPEARTVSTMEVWSNKTLLANVTDNHPRFVVKGLPPDTNLRLRLYTASPHTQSQPVILYAKTKPRLAATTQAVMKEEKQQNPKPPDAKSSSPTEENFIDESYSIYEMPLLLGVIAGGAGLLLVVAALVGIIVLKATKRYSEDAGVDSEMQQTYDDALSESVWVSPTFSLRETRHENQTAFIEDSVESPGEECSLLEKVENLKDGIQRDSVP